MIMKAVLHFTSRQLSVIQQEVCVTEVEKNAKLHCNVVSSSQDLTTEMKHCAKKRITASLSLASLYLFLLLYRNSVPPLIHSSSRCQWNLWNATKQWQNAETRGFISIRQGMSDSSPFIVRQRHSWSLSWNSDAISHLMIKLWCMSLRLSCLFTVNCSAAQITFGKSGY